jgi:hypothetical protein
MRDDRHARRDNIRSLTFISSVRNTGQTNLLTGRLRKGRTCLCARGARVILHPSAFILSLSLPTSSLLFGPSAIRHPPFAMGLGPAPRDGRQRAVEKRSNLLNCVSFQWGLSPFTFQPFRAAVWAQKLGFQALIANRKDALTSEDQSVAVVRPRSRRQSCDGRPVKVGPFRLAGKQAVKPSEKCLIPRA